MRASFRVGLGAVLVVLAVAQLRPAVAANTEIVYQVDQAYDADLGADCVARMSSIVTAETEDALTAVGGMSDSASLATILGADPTAGAAIGVRSLSGFGLLDFAPYFGAAGGIVTLGIMGYALAVMLAEQNQTTTDNYSGPWWHTMIDSSGTEWLYLPAPQYTFDGGPSGALHSGWHWATYWEIIGDIDSEVTYNSGQYLELIDNVSDSNYPGWNGTYNVNATHLLPPLSPLQSDTTTDPGTTWYRYPLPVAECHVQVCASGSQSNGSGSSDWSDQVAIGDFVKPDSSVSSKQRVIDALTHLESDPDAIVNRLRPKGAPAVPSVPLTNNLPGGSSKGAPTTGQTVYWENPDGTVTKTTDGNPPENDNGYPTPEPSSSASGTENPTPNPSDEPSVQPSGEPSTQATAPPAYPSPPTSGTAEDFVSNLWDQAATRFPFDWVLDLWQTATQPEPDLYWVSFSGQTWNGTPVEEKTDLNFIKEPCRWFINIAGVGVVVAALFVG